MKLTKKSALVAAVVVKLALSAVLAVSAFAMRADARPAVPAGEETSFAAVAKQLDTDGNFYLYMSSKEFMGIVERLGGAVKEMVAKLPSNNVDAERKAQIVKGVDLALSMAKSFGMGEVDGVGMSSVAVDKGLYRNKLFLHHPQGADKGLLWKLLGSEPRELKALKLMPADTVLCAGGDYDAELVYRWVADQLRQSGLPDATTGVDSMEQELLQKDIDLKKAFAGYGKSFFLVLTADVKLKTPVPSMLGVVEIPTPGLALGLEVKDDYLFNLLHTKIAPQTTVSVDSGVKSFKALPFPLMQVVNPTIATKDGYLVVALSPEIVGKLFSDKERLVDTPEFKSLAAGMPERGNGFSYSSSRLARIIQEVQAKFMGDSPVAALQKLQGMDNIMGYNVTIVRDDGLLSVGNANVKTSEVIMTQALLLPASIMGAAMLPALNSARGKARSINSASNLKQIGLALKQYAMDNDDKFPAADGAAGLEELRKNDYLSDAKLFVSPMSATAPAKQGEPLTDATVDYCYFGGFGEADPTQVPLAIENPKRIKGAGSVLYLDGHVETASRMGTDDVTGVVAWLIEKNKYVKNQYTPEIVAKLKAKAAMFDKAGK